jgi:hypothetical protein
MAFCEKCGSNENLICYAIPDFVYRHVGKEKLRCKTCGPPQGGQYTDFHDYNSDSDDYFLGLISYHLDWQWGGENMSYCFECSKLIPTSKMGHGIALTTPDPTSQYSKVYPIEFCQGCYRKRKGVRLEDEYAHKLPELYQRTDEWVRNHK